jgi:hypothetical protein
MDFEKPSTPVRLPSSSRNVLILGALESSNQALLDDVDQGSLPRRFVTEMDTVMPTGKATGMATEMATRMATRMATGMAI